MKNSYNTRTTLKVGEKDYEIYSLKALQDDYDLAACPIP